MAAGTILAFIQFSVFPLINHVPACFSSRCTGENMISDRRTPDGHG